MRYVIRYDSHSTVNGVRVGRVYVRSVGDVSPGAFSYTKDPAEASTFERDEAVGLLHRHTWNDAVIVAEGSARERGVLD